MNPLILQALRCPLTHSPLTLEEATYDSAGMVVSGMLRGAGPRRWPIRDGIVRLLARPAPWNGAQLVNRLSAAAWGYERLWRPYALSLLSGRSFPLDEEAALLIEHLAPRRGGLYLDLACSNGFYARTLAAALPDPASSAVIAVDHALPMLQEAARRARAAGVHITLVQALADELPLADGCLAGLACGGSFNEFTNADRVLSEVRRTLEPQGRSWWMLARAATTGAGRWLQRGMRPGGVQFPPTADLLTALAAAGLRVTYQSQTGAVQLAATRGRLIDPASAPQA